MDMRCGLLNFLKNTSGNVAVTIALLGIPLVGTAGAALDYTQLNRKTTILQNATDSAALAAAQHINDKTQQELESLADEFLRTNLSASHYAQIKNVDLVISNNQGSLTITASAKMPTTLISVLGITELDYSRESRVNTGSGSAEIVLVLDNTGSMAEDGKIDALKVAATDFINQLTVNSDIKIGIVPFARYVNVGLDNRNEPWMNVPADFTETTTTESFEIISQGNCPDFIFEEFSSQSIPLSICDDIVFGEPQTQEEQIDNNWKGCAGSRQYPRNLNDDDFSFRVPGILRVSCPSRITELTNDSATLLNEVDAMSPAGSTYIPTGLVWGLRTLSSNIPFVGGVSDAEAESRGIKKIIILMSDGQNTSSIGSNNSAYHGGVDSALANDYTREVCNNIKDKDVQLFTIGFGTNIPQTTEDLLRECSTDGGFYYNAIDNEALNDAFSNIGGQITSFYLSR